MDNKKIAGICILLAVSGYFISRFDKQNWSYILIGLLLGLISLLIAIFKIVLKDKSSKRLSYMVILAIGAFFLAFGLLNK